VKRGAGIWEEMAMQYLQSLSLLEERIQAAVELITDLKSERKKLEAENARLVEIERVLQGKLSTLEAKVGALEDDVLTLEEARETLTAQSQQLRGRQEEMTRFERDRDEIRARIDGMLAKFEELEV
jgi:chromosome segregation ATPase